jgi:hypothetical protein
MSIKISPPCALVRKKRQTGKDDEVFREIGMQF